MNSILKICISILFVHLVCQALKAQQLRNPWSNWDYLIGEWMGDGKGDPGEAKGWFSLKTNLDKNILVRTNHAEFPATKDRPASVHDDLMIVYAGIEGNSAKAIYFDNENHIINYMVSYRNLDSAIILTSEPLENTPRFRFTYKQINDNKIKTIFEIAPPGKPGSFSVYIEGSAHRKE
jgi:hypothetical protein